MPFKAFVAFAGIFFCGGISGAFVVMHRQQGSGAEPIRAQASTQNVEQAAPKKAATPPRKQIAEALMRQLVRRLNLTAEQRKAVNGIVSNYAEQFQRLRQDNARHQQEYLRETERLSGLMHDAVAASLSPEQRAELETMRREVQERAERERQKRANDADAKTANQPAGTPPERPN